MFAICGASTVSKLIPLAGDLGHSFALQPAEFGWLVAMVALPAAIFAIPSGIVVDRLGPRLVLLIAGFMGISANAVYWFAESLPVIYVARLFEGIGVVHIYTAGPALIMTTTSGARRTQSMTIWSTYAPVGTALGLAFAAIYAETENWRTAFLFHTVLYAIAMAMGLFQPAVKPAAAAKVQDLSQRMAQLFSAFRRPQLLMLAATFFLLISMGLGANVTLPVYLPRVNGLSAAAASSMVASATLTMVIGSALAGLILPKGVRPAVMFSILAGLGFIAGACCFYPVLPVSLRMFPLIIWYMVIGAALSTIHATLPVVADPQRPGAAAALLNFAGAIAAFLNPPLWLGIFQRGQWTPFVLLLAIGWGVAVAMIWLAIRFAQGHKETGSAVA